MRNLLRAVSRKMRVLPPDFCADRMLIEPFALILLNSLAA